MGITFIQAWACVFSRYVAKNHIKTTMLHQMYCC